MADFIPETSDYSNPTASEKTFFNFLKEQLFDDDNYTVFFSVPWVTSDGKNNLRGEADFIICNRKYGFLVVEVKGGFGLTVSNRQFYIEESNGDKRLLKVAPSKQAASNMQYFIKTADEGQDFTDEWGMVLESLLNDVEQSIFYIFYDEEQDIFGRNSLKNYFADSGYISPMPYQLTENIRNTKQICEWCKENTGFGSSMNANLVSGVEPTVFEYTDAKNIRKEVGKILYDLTENHGVDPEQIVVLSDRSLPKSVFADDLSAGNYKITKDEATDKQEIKFKTIQSFKGLESDVVIYLQHKHDRLKLNYVGYTRAKYILYVLKLTPK